MTSITFTCQVVTPMFLGSAIPDEIEMRPPAIKGALRFWWRATYSQPENRQKMLADEGELFGSPDEKTGRSKFRVVVKKQPETSGKPLNRGGDGQAYLLYSMVMLNKRPYFAPGSEFVFEISSASSSTINKLLPALGAWVIYGGLGSRVRRGAGALEVTGLTKKNLSSEVLQNATNRLLLNNIGNNGQSLESKIYANIKPARHKKTEHTTVFDCQPKMLNPETSWEAALEALGGPFKNFRHKNKGACKEMAEAFGLPVLHSSTRNTLVAKPNRNDEKLIDRRSSPYIFKVLKTGGNSYFPCIFLMNSQFLPSGYSVAWKKYEHLESKHDAPELPKKLFSLY